MNRHLKYTVLVSMFSINCIALSACSQDAEFATIKHTANSEKPDQPISLSLSIEPGTLLPNQRPKVRLFGKYNLAKSYPVKIAVNEKNANNFDLSIEKLAAGEYRLLADIPYQRSFMGISTGNATQTITYDFLVHDTLAVSCFNFDNKKNDVMGWSSSHVYIDDKEEPISKATCPGLFFVNTSWPARLNETTEGGSLFVPVSSECFPKISNQMSKDPHWTFSINSPALASRQNWQKIKSINFRIATGTMPITIAPEIVFLIDKQKVSTNTSEPKKIFEIAGEGWNTLNYPVKLPKGAIVSDVKLHIYGVPEQTVGTEVNSIFIDGVCPVK